MVERSCTVYSIEYKMSAVKAYLESGEPIKQFCRENNIKYQTFYGWLDKYNKSSEEEKKQLYEITVPLKSLSNKATEIEEAIDIEIEGIRMKIKTKDLKFVMMALTNG